MTTDQELKKLKKAYEDALVAYGKANGIFYDAQKAYETAKKEYYEAYGAYKKALNDALNKRLKS